VINNELVLNTSKTKSIVFGSKHSLRPRPPLKFYVKGVTNEQVEEAKLLGKTFHGQLSWKVVVKMGRGMSVYKNIFLKGLCFCASCSGSGLVPSGPILITAW
jgi:hypothetical protein